MKLCLSPSARRALGFAAVFLLTSAAIRPALAVEKSRLRVDDYQIDVELLPQTHKLTARAAVKVTALEDINVATFQLNNALRITKLTDANNKPLASERNTQDSTVRFALNSGLSKSASTTFTFEYEGTLETADDSPVEGLKLAYVGPETSYLLYSGLWFPVAGYGVNRFTSTINVTVPAHMVVIGSGKEPSAAAVAKKAATACTVCGVAPCLPSCSPAESADTPAGGRFSLSAMNSFQRETMMAKRLPLALQVP